MPICGAKNDLLRLKIPVKTAYIDASIWQGISLAMSTLPDSIRSDYSSEVVTASLTNAKAFGSIPKVNSRVSIIELKLPRAFKPQQTANIVLDSAKRKHALYANMKANRVKFDAMPSAAYSIYEKPSSSVR